MARVQFWAPKRRVAESPGIPHGDPPTSTGPTMAPVRSECLATSGHPGAPSQSVPNLTVFNDENSSRKAPPGWNFQSTT